MKKVIAAFIILSLICAITGGLALSKGIEYFNSLPQPIITHNEAKWGYYVDKCSKEYKITGTENGVTKEFGSFFVNCNI